MNTCTCGAEGKHRHSIDGEIHWLCGHCHAVLKVIQTNPFGWPVNQAISFVYSRDSSEPNVFEVYAREAPSDNALPGHINGVTSLGAVSPNPLSFYEELPESFEEERIPPNFG